ncbi:AMP-binding protein [Qaidamihabitans albus]|uniref:AMP-binding protein n=1 Tax=Qaidamihabitans albus TaxID=2795733 RepID=UPI0018F1D213|nr:AMP-binding protein [Qaidamihabitans albus]
MSWPDHPDLTAWLRAPAADRGVRFAHRDGWDHWSYPRLAGLTRRFAATYRSMRIGDGDVVALLLGTGPEFVAAFYAAAVVGAAAAPVAPPPLFGDDGEHSARIAAALRTATPAVVVTGARHRAHAAALPTVIAEELLAERNEEGASTGVAVPHDSARIALVQFTSGSVAAPRGIRVPCSALTTTISQLGTWLGHTPELATASWLPLHHDMGLVGCLLSPIAHSADLWLLPTEEFIRRPSRYLRCFGEHGAALSAMPAFGLEHVAARVRPRDLDACDFSPWRVLIVGAERVAAGALRRFGDLLRPYGFDPAAIVPAYGLAEATLAVTGTPMLRGWRSVTADPATLVPGSRVREGPRRGTEIVSSGPPLAPTRVRVVDDDGHAVNEGVVGEIVVESPTVAAGYTAGQGIAGSRLDGATLHTGDAGFLLDGELYVLGRLGDAMKLRGRTVLAEELEAGLAEGGSRPVIALGPRAGEPVLLAVVGATEPAERVRDIRAVLARVGEGAEVAVRRVPAARIPRTTSGKPRRRELFRRFLAGELDEVAGTYPIS